jgi:hypothetical protein
MSQTPLFISHTFEEAELALLLKDMIVEAFPNAATVYVSSDDRSVRAGDKWLADLEVALKRSSLHIVLCSQASVRRPWVNFEAGAAWIAGTTIVPVCHSGMKPHLLPLPLNTLQGVLLGGSSALKGLLNRVAEVVGQDAGPVDVTAWASTIREAERRLSAAAAGIRIVKEPRVLCATIPHFADNFAKDIRILGAAFDDLTVCTDLDRAGLVQLLSSGPFDILHFYLPVLPDSGDLVFEPLELYGGGERLAASAFREQVEASGASLVVLATCKAVLLAIQVAPVCNMIACDIAVDERQIEDWMNLFYPTLAKGRSVSSAHRLATQSSYVPMYHLRGEDVGYQGKGQVRIASGAVPLKADPPSAR